MTERSILISLPIADRVRAHEFYGEALGLTTIGDLGDDGVPEPLTFVLNAATNLMLIPSGGFGWVIGDHTVATSGTSECMLGLAAATVDEVRAILDRAVAAGASIVSEPGERPWGYAAAFADPNGHIWMISAA